MQIDQIRFFPMAQVLNPAGTAMPLAYVSFVVDGWLKIAHCRLIELYRNEETKWTLAFPSRRCEPYCQRCNTLTEGRRSCPCGGRTSNHRDTVFPIVASAREEIEDVVFEAFEAFLADGGWGEIEEAKESA